MWISEMCSPLYISPRESAVIFTSSHDSRAPSREYLPRNPPSSARPPARMSHTGDEGYTN